MENMKYTTINKIKCGTAFIFDVGGSVFVKCRGGFRYGTGGQLHSCSPTQSIILCNPANGMPL